MDIISEPRTLAFLAAPYDSGTDAAEAVYRATLDAVTWFLRNGINVIAPTLMVHSIGQERILPTNRDYYAIYEEQLLRHSDELWILEIPGHDTQKHPGVRRAKEVAREANIPTHYVPWTTTGEKNAESVTVQRITPETKLPARRTAGSAGYDLHADEETTIPPGEQRLIPTGIKIALPNGSYGQVAPRSSLSIKGVHTNAGVIGADYRGEVKVLLENRSPAPFVVNRHDRIAQLIIQPILTPTLVEGRVGDTACGAGGFGSTGR